MIPAAVEGLALIGAPDLILRKVELRGDLAALEPRKGYAAPLRPIKPSAQSHICDAEVEHHTRMASRCDDRLFEVGMWASELRRPVSATRFQAARFHAA